MTTVAEIECAVERLPREGVEQLANWLVDYQNVLNASAATFRQYEAEEGDAENQWIGER